MAKSPNRFRAFLALVALVALEATAFLVLRWADGVQRWQVDFGHFGRWLDVTPRVDVVAGLALTALEVIVGYLALTTGLYLLATVTRIRPLMSLTGAFTLPGIRRVVQGGLAVGMTGSLMIQAAPAMAHTAPNGGWARGPVATAAPAPVPGADQAAPAVAPTATAEGRWEVARHDNLWDISAAALAEARGVDVGSLRSADVVPYWRTVCDANIDRIRSGDANLIYPDEEVFLPPVDGAVAPAPPATAVPEAPAAAPTPAPAEAPAEAAVDEAPAAPAEAPVDTSAAEAPADAPADAPEASVDTTVGQNTGEELPAAVAPASSRAPIAPLLGVGLLGGGVVLLLRRKRGRHDRRREPDEVTPVPTPREAATEWALEVSADVDGVVSVELALRAMAAGMDVTSEDSPVPLGVLLGDRHLEVVLSRPGPAPVPFTAAGSRWRLSRNTDEAELRRLADQVPMPMPALLSLGRAAGGEEVLIDAEATGIMALEGDGAVDLVRAAGLQLATSPWSQVASVVLVGFEDAPDEPHVQSYGSLDWVLDRLDDEAREIAALLGEVRADSTLEARARRVQPDAFLPTVVVCLEAPPDHLARRLAEMCLNSDLSADRAGVAAIVAGHVPGASWQLELSGRRLVVPEFGVDVDVETPEGEERPPPVVVPLEVVEPQAVTSDEMAGVVDLLTAADEPPAPPGPDYEPPIPVVEVPVDPPLLVRVLGPVHVDGATVERGKSMEELAYLATHRKALVDNDRLVEALWPGVDPTQKASTLWTTTSKLRQALGDAPDGRPYLPKAADNLYRLHELLLTDLDLLVAALDMARTSSAPAVIEALANALELVDGKPFTHGGHGYEWARAEGLVRFATLRVSDAAHLLSEHYRGGPGGEGADLPKAEWAATQGLLVDQFSELLHRDLMLARPASASAVLEGLAAALGDDDEPDLETTELARRLTA